MTTKRTVDYKIGKKAIDILIEDEDQQKKPPKPEKCGNWEYLFFIAQFVCIVVYGTCTEYGKGVSHKTSDEPDDKK